MKNAALEMFPSISARFKGATVDDLDLDLFRRSYLPSAVAPEVLAENDRTVEQQLASLHFLASDGMPNAAALLVFGRSGSWIPGGYIQFARFVGVALTDAIRHQKEVTGRCRMRRD